MKDLEVILAELPGFGRVRLCECSVIHMTIGPVTLTLAKEAFRQTAHLLNAASEEMARIAAALEFQDECAPGLHPSASRLTH